MACSKDVGQPQRDKHSHLDVSMHAPASIILHRITLAMSMLYSVTFTGLLQTRGCGVERTFIERFAGNAKLSLIDVVHVIMSRSVLLDGQCDEIPTDDSGPGSAPVW